LLRSIVAGADAIGDADAAVAVASECESGQLLAEALDADSGFLSEIDVVLQLS
jgi:hypothetical protein